MSVAKCLIKIHVEDTSLSVDQDCIDATFGNGVAAMYTTKADDLALRNVTVMYDRKTKKLL